MNAIIGMTRLMLNTQITERQRDYLSKIVNASDALLEIINDILDISKIEAGRMAMESTDFWLDEVLDQLSSIITGRASGKDLELRFSTDERVPRALTGDPLRLGQVLINLASNAVKFTERGEIVVATDLVEREGNKVRLKFSVRDTGIGISQDQITGLFQAFTQADESTTRRYGGTGLGLAICKKLVEMMGGEIEVQSVPGEGSTFSFTVCFAVAQKEPTSRGYPPSAEVAVSTSAHTRLRGCRVLLVEDNPINQQVAVEMLRGAGLVVEIANNGREAVEALSPPVAADHFDVVLMDLQMPKMNGYQATRMIRRDPRLNELPIIAITAHAMEEERAKCLAAGMNDHVSKPIDAELLLITLSLWINPIPPPQDDIEATASSAELGLPESLPGLDVAAGVKRVSGASDLYRSMLRTFLETKSSDAEAIRQAVADGDLTGARGIAHAIKGVAGNLSATTLHRAATTLDAVLRNEDHRHIPAALEAFEKALREVLTSIRELIAS